MTMWHPITIPADKPGAALAVEAAGFAVLRLDGQWQASDPAAQAVVDGYQPPAPPRRMVALAVVCARLSVLGGWAAVEAVLAAAPEARAAVLGVTEGIYADDAQARAIFAAAGLDPDVILA
jgi:hypothetical protein